MKNIIIISGLSASLLFLAGISSPPSGTTVLTKPISQLSKDSGVVIYKKFCMSCHQADGGGVPNMSPPLIGTSFVLGDKETLIGIVLNGLKNVNINDETYSNPMPPLGDVLNDQQIAVVLTYIRNSFGNKASAITREEVKAARKNFTGNEH